MAVERIEGVQEAAFSYRDGTGTVRFDTSATSTESIIRELATATGYKASVREDLKDGSER